MLGCASLSFRIFAAEAFSLAFLERIQVHCRVIVFALNHAPWAADEGLLSPSLPCSFLGIALVSASTRKRFAARKVRLNANASLFRARNCTKAEYQIAFV